MSSLDRIRKVFKDVGRAKGTLGNDKRGLDTLNWWLVNQRKTMTLHELTHVYVEGENLLELIYDLSDFLQNTTLPKYFDSNPSTTENLAPVTLSRYLDGAIYNLELKYPKHPFWKSDDAILLDGITGAAFLTGCSRSQTRKEDLFGQGKKMPLYSYPREDMIRGGKNHWLYACTLETVAIELMKVSNHGVSSGNPQEKRCIAIATKMGAGRSGEVKYLKYNEFVMDIFIGCCDTGWTELKTLNKYSSPQPPGKRYACCFLHAWICFVCIEDGLYRAPGQLEIAQFVFPSLHNMKDESVASHITSIYRDTLPIPEDAKKDISSKSSRIGAVNELLVHSGVTHEEKHFRTGHSLGTNQQSYADRTCPALTLPGGIALAGWKDARTPKRYPTFGALDNHCRPSVDRFIEQLVPNVSVPQFKRGEPLWPLLEAGAACLVMWHQDVTRDLGFANAISSKVRESARNACIQDASVGSSDTDVIINSWSERIKDNFFNVLNPDFRPLSNDPSGQDISAALNLMAQQMTSTNMSMSKLVTMNQDQTKTIANQGAQINRLEGVVNVLRAELARQEAHHRSIFRTPERPGAWQAPSQYAGAIAGFNPNQDLQAAAVDTHPVVAHAVADTSANETAPAVAPSPNGTAVDTPATASAAAAADITPAPAAAASAAATAAPASDASTGYAPLFRMKPVPKTKKKPNTQKKARLSHENKAEASSKPSNAGKDISDLINEAWTEKKLIAKPLVFATVSMPLHLDDKGKWEAIMELLDFVITNEQVATVQSTKTSSSDMKDLSILLTEQCKEQMTKWDGIAGGGSAFTGLGKRIQTYKHALEKASGNNNLRDMPTATHVEVAEEETTNEGTPEGNRSIGDMLGFNAMQQWRRQKSHNNDNIQIRKRRRSSDK